MNEQYYNVTHREINILTRASSDLFRKFTSSYDAQALQESLEKCNESIMVARANINPPPTKYIVPMLRNQIIENNQSAHYDLAFCLRKYASIIIRDKNDKDRYIKARIALEESLTIHNNYNSDKNIIILEKQRILHQLRKVAYELKDGNLLKSSVNILFESSQINDNKQYLFDCHESNFHIAFANQSYIAALYYITQNLISLSENSIDVYTCYRHQGKIYLAELENSNLSIKNSKQYLIDVIESTFWKSYDGHKNNLAYAQQNSLTNDIKKIKQQLVKDLIFLFSLRCKKSLLFGEEKCPPKNYVLKEAKNILGSNNSFYVSLEKTLDEKINFIKEHHYLPLDYQFFESIKPPNIIIPADKIDTLFSIEKTEHIGESRNSLFSQNSITTNDPITASIITNGNGVNNTIQSFKRELP